MARELAMDEETRDRAREIYQDVLAERPSDVFALCGLAELPPEEEDTSFASEVKARWATFDESVRAPWATIALACLGVALVWLVLARLIAGKLVGPDCKSVLARSRVRVRALGVGLIAISAVTLVAGALIEGTAALLTLGLLGLLAAVVLTVSRSRVLGTSPPRVLSPGSWGHNVILALAVLASVCTVAALLAALPAAPGMLVQLAESVAVIGIVLAAGVGGAAVFALAQGQGLRLKVEVSDYAGKADANQTAFLVGQLSRLGTDKPAGLRVPTGTDVTELPPEALTSLPQGAVAAAASRVARTVLPIVPWEANVRLLDHSTADIALTRNRHAVDDSRLLSRTDLGLAPLGADASDEDESAARQQLLTAAAAVILMALRQRDDELNVGLCGATEPLSVALQAIASLPGPHPTSLRRGLLHRSFVTDPANNLARLGWLSTQQPDGGRTWASIAGDLDALHKSITRAGQSDTTGYLALELRLAHNRAAAWLNTGACALTATNDPALRTARRKARVALGRLEQLAKQAQERAATAPLAEQVVLILPFLHAGLELLADLPPAHQDPQNGEPFAGSAAYARACWLAGRQLRGVMLDDDWPRLWDELRLALVANDQLKAWMVEDPWLYGLWRLEDKHGETFRAIAGEPRAASFLDLPPLQDHCEKLRVLGLTTPEDMLTMRRSELANAAEVSDTLAQRWRDLAILLTAPWGADDRGKRLTVGELHLLWSLDVHTRTELHAALRRPEFADELKQGCKGAAYYVGDQRLQEWKSWVPAEPKRPRPWAALQEFVRG